jgi:hypothetical protein
MMSDYQRETAEKTLKTQRISAAIAASLSTGGELWEAEVQSGEYATYNYARLLGRDGEVLYLSFDYHRHKLTVSGSYGQLPDGRVWIPRDANVVEATATMSMDREPAQLARDITRRVLPTYRENRQLYKARVESMTEYHAAALSFKDALVTAADGRMYFRADRGHDKSEHAGDIRNTAGISCGTLRVTRDSLRVDMLYLEGDTAILFAEFLAHLPLKKES